MSRPTLGDWVVAVTVLVVVTAAAVLVAALPELVVVPDAIAVGARGLAAGCLAVLYALGVGMQSWLWPRRKRP